MTVVHLFKDWWLFALGAIIGIIVKVDDYNQDKQTIYLKKDLSIHRGWLCVNLLLAAIKGALVMVGAFVLISAKVQDPTTAIVLAGIVTMSFDPVWIWVRKRTVFQLGNIDRGMDSDDIFK